MSETTKTTDLELSELLLNDIEDGTLAKLRVSTGMDDLDRAMNFMKGELVLVLAESGSGKSTFATTVLSAAARSGKVAQYHCVEDSAIEVASRVASGRINVPAATLSRGSLTKAQARDLREGMDRNYPYEIILHQPDVDKICAAIDDAASGDGGLDVVAVDYLQTLRGGKGQDRRNQVRDLVEGMQATARKHGILLLLMSQVIRPESRKVGEKPTVHWAKESSDIRDKSDKILLMWRTDPTDRSAPTLLECGKDKSGVANGRQFKAYMDLSTNRFRVQAAKFGEPEATAEPDWCG